MPERKFATLRQAVTPVLAISRLEITSKRANPLASIDRWQAAFQLLEEEEKKGLGDIISPTATIQVDLLLQKVCDGQDRIEKRKWVLYKRSDGQQIYFRDVFARFISAIRRFQGTISNVVQCEVTGYAAAPWAVIQLFLNAMGNDTETFGEMLSGITKVSEVIARNTELEKQRFKGVSELKKQLSTCITRLYRAVLSFLYRAIKYFSRNTASRIIHSAVQTPAEAVAKYLKPIEDAELDVMRLVNYVSDEDQGRRLSSIPLAAANEVKRQAAEEAASVTNRRKKLLGWIQAIDTEDTLRATLDKKQIGTCSWILDKQSFQSWLNSSPNRPSLLWIHGPPGFGKTFLSASISEKLSQQNSRTFSSFFCLAEDESRRDPFAILRQWVAGTIAQNDKATHAVFREFESRKGQDEFATSTELWKAFQVIGKAVPQLTLLVDGYDECTQTKSLLKYHTDDSRTHFLQELLKIIKHTSTKVVIVSRDIPEISSALTVERCDENGILRFEHKITPEDSSSDISLCSREMIQKRFPKKFSDETKNRLAAEAASRSEGMFLWLAMFGKSMKQWDSEEKLRKKIVDMPAELEQIYEAELDRVLKPDRDDNAAAMAESILRWTLFAARPLTVREMAEALALAPEGTDPLISREDVVPDDWSEIDNEYVDTYFKKPCGILVQLQSRDETTPLYEQTIHFPHFSIKEFLLRRAGGQAKIRAEQLYLRDRDSENQILAKMCLQYICLDVIPQDPKVLRSDKILRQRLKLWPFLTYCSKYWSQHASLKNGIAPELLPYIQRLFSPTTTHWKLWSKVFETELFDDDSDSEDSDSGSDGSDDDNDAEDSIEEQVETTSDAEEFSISTAAKGPTPLYYAAYLGLTDIVADLCSQGFDCCAKGGKYSFPLAAAAYNGHLETVKFLLETGADVNQQDDEDWTAAHYAALSGQADVLDHLASTGASLTALDEYGLSPVHYACRAGSQEALKVCLNHNSLFEDIEGGRESPLITAIESSQDTVVEFLLNNGFSPLTSRLSNTAKVTTPLGSAFLYGTMKTVELLIDKAADLEAAASGDNLLVLMASENNQQRFAWLWDRGIRAQCPDESGKGVLHWASRWNNAEILRMYLTKAKDLDTVDPDGVNALMFASMFGSLQAVALLIENGATVNFQDRPGGASPVYFACCNNETEVLEHLIQAGADPHITFHGSTGFDVAVHYHCLEVIQLLISHGALRSLDGTFAEELVPLQQAAVLDNVDNVKQEIEKLNGNKKSLAIMAAIPAAAAGGAENTIKWLCSQNVHEGFVGTNGRTAIHMAVDGGYDAIVECLLDAGHSCVTPDDFECLPVFSAAVARGLGAEEFVIKHLVRGELSLGRQVEDRSQINTQDLFGNWTGKYTYVDWEEGREDSTALEMQPYSNFLADSNMTNLNVAATVLPFLFYHKSTDPAGDFTIHGQFLADNKVAFLKLYQWHGWLYHGEISEDGTSFHGTWGSSPQLWHGTFQMHRLDGSKEKET